MMTAPATTILDEMFELISAQLDALGDPTSLTSTEVSEFHSRAEKIRLLCEGFD